MKCDAVAANMAEKFDQQKSTWWIGTLQYLMVNVPIHQVESWCMLTVCLCKPKCTAILATAVLHFMENPYRRMLHIQ